jgi:ribA/ribD-fused uncharacterized protein
MKILNVKTLLKKPEWDDIKNDVMYRAIESKFTQHSKLRDVLLGTSDGQILYQNKNDFYWGTGEDGNGANMLGKLLMKLRQSMMN